MNVTFWTAVAIASLVGSLHCAGMCGPIAALAGGTGRSGSREGCDSQGGCAAPRRSSGTTLCYQAGRLTTYLAIGLAAGALGAALDLGGDWVGWQVGAAWLAGITSIGIGVAVLVKHWLGRFWHLPLPKGLMNFIVRVRKASAGWSPRARATTLGLVTGLLPCGWLYTFVLVAAGTGSPWAGAAVMGLLWAGALPVLVSLGISARWIAGRWGRHATWATAVLVIAIGVTTIRSRASAAWEEWLGNLSQHPVVLDGGGIETLTNEKKPCCEAAATALREAEESATAEADGSQGP